jgi:hypothetical protein
MRLYPVATSVVQKSVAPETSQGSFRNCPQLIPIVCRGVEFEVVVM